MGTIQSYIGVNDFFLATGILFLKAQGTLGPSVLQEGLLNHRGI